MTKIFAAINFLLISLISWGQSGNSEQSQLYDLNENCRFLWHLHHQNFNSTNHSTYNSDSTLVYADYSAAHPDNSSSTILAEELMNRRDDRILFALSQQENTHFEKWITGYINDETTNEAAIGWIGKCIRSEKDAITFRKFKNKKDGYALGLYYAMRNGYYFDFMSMDLLQIVSENIRLSLPTTNVCRAIKTIPIQHYPIEILDSLFSISKIDNWNNRMAIQMIGKNKSSKSIENLISIAIIEEQDEALIVECLLQLMRQSNFDVQKIITLLNHSNDEIIALTIDCIVQQKRFEIPVNEIITSVTRNHSKEISKILFWKIKYFELQKKPDDERLIRKTWKAFLEESNPYHRLLAFDAIKNCKSLFPQLLDYIMKSSHATDLYYGTTCLISMYPSGIIEKGFEKLWNLNDEGVDALLYEFLREQEVPTDRQERIKTQIHQRISTYTLPKMVETRNEALMTLAHWGDTLSMPKNYDSGLKWTPEQLAALPNESKYLMITFHDDTLDTISFSVIKENNPLTALHFSNLVAEHFYENKYFHRRVSNFVLQGGCPRGDGMGSLDYTIASEFSGRHFEKGSIGWASAGPHTESCQIFFMLDEAYTLDGRYTNMGDITSGLEHLIHLPLGTQILSIQPIH